MPTESNRSRVAEFRTSLATFKGVLRERNQAVERAKGAAERAQIEVNIKLDAQRLLELAAKERGKSREYVAELATYSLQASRGPEYTFSLVQDEKGIIPMVTEDGYTDHVEGFGGAAQSSCGAGVRLATVLLHPELAPLMVLDEPQRNLSTTAFLRWIQWVGTMSDRVGLQTLMVSHHLKGVPESAVPNTFIYKVERKGTFSTVSRLSEAE